jgi:uncharacterized damage-inducible protein DinB
MPGQGSRIDFVTGAPEKYADLVDALAVIPNKYRAALAGVSDGAMRAEPADGGWSAQRNLAHVVFVTEANDVFIHQMAKMTNPVRKAFPVGYVAEDLENHSLATLLQRLDDAIGRTVTLLGHTPDAAWGRPGEARGMRRSIRQMVVYHIAHFDEHLAEIAKLAGAKTAAR